MALQAARRLRRQPGRALRARPRLRYGLIQIVYLVAGIALGVAVPLIEVGRKVPTAQLDQMLITTGAGIITFIGVVYSLLFLVVQFGTTTFTPRLNLFRDSAVVAHGFAFFTSVVVFCFTAALASQGGNGTVIVPIVMMVLILLSLAMFRQIQAAAFRSIQLSAVLEQVKQRGRDVIDGLYPDRLGAVSGGAGAVAPVSPETAMRWEGEAAVLQAIDVAQLVTLAATARVSIECPVMVGDVLYRGDVYARVTGGTLDREAEGKLRRTFSTGPERTFEQDPRLVFRVLTDIALRALSPAVNDPTTATQALHATESLLRDLVTRDLDIAQFADEAGTVYVRLTVPTWDDYVQVATEEVIPASRSSVQVRRALEGMVTRLIAIAPPGRDASLQDALSDARAVPAL